MSDLSLLDKTMDMALQLPVIERLQLVERLVASVEREISPTTIISDETHWGENLVTLIESLDLSDWEALDINDPVEWVNQIRQQEESRLKPYWDGDK